MAQKYSQQAMPRASRPVAVTAIVCESQRRVALVLEIGTRIETDAAHYPDIDMVAPPRGEPAIYKYKDGTPYQEIKRRGPEL